MSRVRDALAALPFLVSGCILSGFAAYGAYTVGANSVERARATPCDSRADWCTVCDMDADYCAQLPEDPCYSPEHGRVLPGLVGDDC